MRANITTRGRSSTTLVVAFGHRFPDLDQERSILEPAGIVVADAANAALDEAGLLRDAAGVLLGAAPLPSSEFEAMSACRAIVRYGVGVDNLDLDAARRRGIVISRVPDYGSEDVAFHAVTLIAALARRLRLAAAETAADRWGLANIPIPHRPSNEVVGVVGLGKIGRHVARLSSALGYRVLGADVVPPVDDSIEVVPLADLLRRSTYVTLHVPLTDETRGLIGAAEIAAMPRGSFIVNTSRGGLIDEEALYAALVEGRLAGAALDVLAEEPPAPAQPLLRMSQVIVTPHMAWYSAEAKASLQRQAAEEMLRILTGEDPRWAVVRVRPISGTRTSAKWRGRRCTS